MDICENNKLYITNVFNENLYKHKNFDPCIEFFFYFMIYSDVRCRSMQRISRLFLTYNLAFKFLIKLKIMKNNGKLVE